MNPVEQAVQKATGKFDIQFLVQSVHSVGQVIQELVGHPLYSLVEQVTVRAGRHCLELLSTNVLHYIEFTLSELV